MFERFLSFVSWQLALLYTSAKFTAIKIKNCSFEIVFKVLILNKIFQIVMLCFYIACNLHFGHSATVFLTKYQFLSSKRARVVLERGLQILTQQLLLSQFLIFSPYHKSSFPSTIFCFYSNSFMCVSYLNLQLKLTNNQNILQNLWLLFPYNVILQINNK